MNNCLDAHLGQEGFGDNIYTRTPQTSDRIFVLLNAGLLDWMVLDHHLCNIAPSYWLIERRMKTIVFAGVRELACMRRKGYISWRQRDDKGMEVGRWKCMNGRWDAMSWELETRMWTTRRASSWDTLMNRAKWIGRWLDVQVLAGSTKDQEDVL